MTDTFTIKQSLSFGEYYKNTLYYFLTGKLVLRYLIFLMVLIFLSSVLGYMTTDKYQFTWIELLQFVRPVFGLVLFAAIFTFLISILLFALKTGVI